MYRGRYQLGDTVQLAVMCHNLNGTPGTPSTLNQCPVALVTGGSLVTSLKVPIQDRYAQDGFFSFPLLLDARFAAGYYTVLYQWQQSSSHFESFDEFEIAAGGDGDGPVLGMFFYRRPAGDYLLLHTDSKRMIRRRNPRVA